MILPDAYRAFRGKPWWVWRFSATRIIIPVRRAAETWCHGTVLQRLCRQRVVGARTATVTVFWVTYCTHFSCGITPGTEATQSYGSHHLRRRMDISFNKE